jgi:hypothetical protein
MHAMFPIIVDYSPSPNIYIYIYIYIKEGYN